VALVKIFDRHEGQEKFPMGILEVMLLIILMGYSYQSARYNFLH